MIPQNFLFISWKYLFSQQKNSTIKYMTRICFLGIFLAVFSLSFIMSIMKGFEAATYTTMQNIYPDLILDAHEDIFDVTSIDPILTKEKYQIAHYSGQALAQGLLHNPEHETTPLVVQIKGINHEQEAKTTNLIKTICNDKTLQETINNNKILLGKKAAQTLHLLPGESVALLYSEESEVSSMQMQEVTLTIGGLFETGIDEYDYALMYCSLELFKSLFPGNDVSQIYIKLKNKSQELSIKKMLQQDLAVDTYSWKDLYPTILSAMKLESLGMFLILFLIICIATINVISVLFMYIYQKQKNIALFVCMGISKHKIRYIFLCISMIITGSAALLGIIASYATGIILQTYPIITLPENVYYTSVLPWNYSFYTSIMILFITLCISYIASLIPLQKISRMNITLLLKNE